MKRARADNHLSNFARKYWSSFGGLGCSLCGTTALEKGFIWREPHGFEIALTGIESFVYSILMISELVQGHKSTVDVP